MVGTHWLWVTEYFSRARRASSASKRSSMTTVPPSDWTAVLKPTGAEWYMGAVDRYTVSASARNRPLSVTPMARPFETGRPESGRAIPFGRPVVPEL